MEEEQEVIYPGRHILLAEDQSVNAQITIKLLEKRQVVVNWVRNGQQALGYFTRAPIDYYDLILMDIRMPVMTGIQATRKLRQLERPDANTVPVIALTSDATGDAMETFTQLGMDDLLPKPVRPAQLDALMEKWSPAPLNRTRRRRNRSAAAVNFTKRPEIRGLDVAAALELTDGDIQLYLDALHTYCGQIMERAKLIETCLERNDLRRYAIEIHALRSAAKQIGALEFAEQATGLESAGDAGDLETLNDDTPPLLKAYRAQKERFEEDLEDYERAMMPEKFAAHENTAYIMDIDQLCLELQSLRDMLAEDLLDAAVRHLTLLQEWEHRMDGRKLMRVLTRKFDEFDYDGAIAQIDVFLQER
jgi:CheY-like chemotaxis protein